MRTRRARRGRRLLAAGAHDGTVAAGREDAGDEGATRVGAAGLAAVQRAGLTAWDWATLLKRVWGGDALNCVGCGGRMRFIAETKDRAVIERILKHIDEDAEETKFARARDPRDLWA